MSTFSKPSEPTCPLVRKDPAPLLRRQRGTTPLSYVVRGATPFSSPLRENCFYRKGCRVFTRQPSPTGASTHTSYISFLRQRGEAPTGGCLGTRMASNGLNIAELRGLAYLPTELRNRRNLARGGYSSTECTDSLGQSSRNRGIRGA